MDGAALAGRDGSVERCSLSGETLALPQPRLPFPSCRRRTGAPESRARSGTAIHVLLRRLRLPWDHSCTGRIIPATSRARIDARASTRLRRLSRSESRRAVTDAACHWPIQNETVSSTDGSTSLRRRTALPCSGPCGGCMSGAVTARSFSSKRALRRTALRQPNCACWCQARGAKPVRWGADVVSASTARRTARSAPP